MALSLAQASFVGGDTSALTALVTPTFVLVVGDILVVKASVEGTTTISLPTATGCTFTSRATSPGTTGNCGAAIATGTVTTGGTVTVSQGFASTAGRRSVVVEQWKGATLAATPATNVTKTGSGVATNSLTTAQANSVVSWLDADWTAQVGAPVLLSGAVQDGYHWITGAYMATYGYQLQGGAAGARTFGASAPAGQTWTMLGIEVQATGATAPWGLAINMAQHRPPGG